ncbi:hypothetical protein [Leptospira kirschneri]|uniref:hypothetical protein n=1 Tax=Leptospira kirschneri TaxID=29507 RepID=UPI0021003BDE|nr:hypothetical protein [Leptospira kirschneri]
MSLDLAKLVTEDFKNGNEQEYSKRFTARPKTRRTTIEARRQFFALSERSSWIGSYKSILKYYDVKNQIAWDWASMDPQWLKRA